MENQELVDFSYFEKEMKEIDELQKQVADILYNKNPLYRFFHFHKAVKLHLLASEKLKNLFGPMEKIK